MKNVCLLITALVITACDFGSSGGGGGGGGSTCVDTQTTYDYEYDQISETQLTLKATRDQYTFISFEQIEAEYIDVEKCVADNNTPGPTVIFTSFNDYGFPLDLALYYYALQTVFIDTDVEVWLPTRNCISDRELLRHEFTHHILFLNGQDSEHTNPKFNQCDALGYNTCNGQYCER